MLAQLSDFNFFVFHFLFFRVRKLLVLSLALLHNFDWRRGRVTKASKGTEQRGIKQGFNHVDVDQTEKRLQQMQAQQGFVANARRGALGGGMGVNCDILSVEKNKQWSRESLSAISR